MRPSPHPELTTPPRLAQAGPPEGPVLVISSDTQRWPRQQDPVMRDTDLELSTAELAWPTGENGTGRDTVRIIAPDT